MANPNCPAQPAGCGGLGVQIYLDDQTGLPIASGRPCFCVEAERRAHRAAQALARADIPPLYAHASWEDYLAEDEDKRRALKNSQALASERLVPGSVVIMAGVAGAGKTYLACAIALEQAKNFGLAVRYVSFPDYIRRLMPDALPKREQESLRDAALGVDLLILDELGVEKPSSFAMRELYSIIDWRYKYQKPTIVTTNHDDLLGWLRSLAGEAGEIGERIASRLQQFGAMIMVGHHDYRPAMARARREERAAALQEELEKLSSSLGSDFAAAATRWLNASGRGSRLSPKARIEQVNHLKSWVEDFDAESVMAGIDEVIEKSATRRPLITEVQTAARAHYKSTLNARLRELRAAEREEQSGG